MGSIRGLLSTNFTPWFALQVVAGLLVLGLVCFLFLSIYNIYFHPLASYPGPKIATSSQIWYIYMSLTGHLPHKLKLLHDKYGDVVRFAPNELSYINSNVWKEIYGQQISKEHPEMPKDFHFTVPLGTMAITVAGYDDHHRYRKKLAPVFSEKSMREQEPVIKLYLDLLLRQLKERSGSVVNMCAWYNFTTFDIIGDLGFGEPFGCLESGEYHRWISFIFPQVKANMSMQAVSRIPIISNLLAPFLVPKSSKERKMAHLALTNEKLLRRLENKGGRKDFIDQLSSKNPPLLSFEELRANASTLIVAGSETTATAMTGLTYFLLRNPAAMTKAVQEIRSAFQSDQEIDMTSINRLTYLNACIEEALRLYPPVGFGVPRSVPGKGAIINGKWVPGGTVVQLQQWSAYRSPLNFRDAALFVPERWLDDPRYADDNKAVFQPFHLGPRNCIGKSLAYVEMRMIVASVLWNFDLELMPDSVDWMAYQRSFQLWEKDALNVKIQSKKSQ